MEQCTVHAPYNFVPFSGKILEYQGTVPAHDAADPTLKTGEIHVTLTAKTPVFVSDGNRDDPHFVRGPNGQLMLPGSTIRGMVRQNMQVLGFGLVRPDEDVQDQRVFYRKVADARDSTGGELKQYYHSALAVKSMQGPSGKNYSSPQNVKSGYLRKSEGGYYIQPTEGAYLKVSKDTLATAGLESRYAEAIPVYYAGDGDYVRQIRRAGGSAPCGMRSGMLLCPGVDAGGDGTRGGNPKPPSHRYVFPPADEAASPIGISEEDALSYAMDWEGRRNSLKGGTQIQGKKVEYDPDFWKLPEGDEKKPVFYIQYNGHVYFGMSLFLRVGYRFSLKDGLPQHHRQKAEDLDFLDYPHAILGYTMEKGSLRSRVSFGDFPAHGSPKEQPLVTTILGNPKISYYPGYVVKGEHYSTTDDKNSEQPGFQLRGYKLYWLKEAGAASTDKEKAASKLRPLPAGTVFSGVIRYRNLRPDELGLLLWALRLENGCFQSVGMGKPYGYGRMELTIDCLREFDLPAMYTLDGLCRQAESSPPEAVQKYIDTYDALAAKALYIKKPKKKPSVKTQDEIQDFFYLHSTVWKSSESVGYMDLQEYRNNRNPLPGTADFRKNDSPASGDGGDTGGDSSSPGGDALYEALRNKFKKL